MQASLKDANKPLLTLVVIANVAIYYTVLNGLDFASFTRIIQNVETYVPAALLALIVGILNSQLDHSRKARLVFWRWKNPLPGSIAFSKIMNSDDRIDPEVLRSVKDPLPHEPSEQNRLWYKWYREFQNETAIKQVHREYLFTRDWSSLTVLLMCFFLPLAAYQMSLQNSGVLLVVLILQYLLVRHSAVNHGNRFVASVLAYKSAST